MDKIKDFMDFCNNPYSKELTKGFSLIANYTASILHNSSESFSRLTNGEDSNVEAAAKHDNLIDKICCLLQRTVAFCDAITTEPTNFRRMKADTYLTNFATGCRRILGDKHDITVGTHQDFVFSSVSELLDLLLLGFIRKICSSAGFLEAEDSSAPSFELSAHIKNGVPEITVNTNVNLPKRNYDTMGALDFFEEYSDEITGLIARKLNVETEISSSHMTIRFNERISDDIIIAEQPRLQLANEGRSIFKIMLSDL